MKEYENKFKRGEKANRKCPFCQNIKIWKSGFRETKNGLIQRFECSNCSRIFSDPTVLSIGSNISDRSQVGVSLQEATWLLSLMLEPIDKTVGSLNFLEQLLHSKTLN